MSFKEHLGCLGQRIRFTGAVCLQSAGWKFPTFILGVCLTDGREGFALDAWDVSTRTIPAVPSWRWHVLRGCELSYPRWFVALQPANTWKPRPWDVRKCLLQMHQSTAWKLTAWMCKRYLSDNCRDGDSFVYQLDTDLSSMVRKQKPASIACVSNGVACAILQFSPVSGLNSAVLLQRKRRNLCFFLGI